ncbi:MAG: TonB-dependent receptor [Acidobacteria bacterium]|nr:TonB-dependent receptor [Acidobacteriota bacterium]
MRDRTPGVRQVIAMVVFVVVTLIISGSVCAQETRGTITGKVRGPSNVALPGASVKIINVAMGTTVLVVTNDAGFFQAPYLIPGTYQIAVEVTGFRRYVRDGLVLRIGQTIETDILLEIGVTEEVVTITVTAPSLESTTASMSQILDSRRVAELPLVHGDPYTLIGLSPGVAYGRDQRLDRPFEPTHIVGYSINGTRANRSDLMIDGVPSTATANAFEVIASYVPPMDIVQEFKVQTATYDAQFGNTEGGVTSISIKSGTNLFHGTAYFWGEPGSLAAKDFFGNLRGEPRPDTYSNRFGGMIGGPVYLRKLYNGRDKTFFMFGFEGIRDSRPRYDSNSPTVPTAAMKNGDFSAFLNLTNGPQYQIYNPFTRRIDPARPGHYIQDPFPNNIIPSNLINPVARALLQYFPDPKNAGTTPDFLNNNTDATLAEKTKNYNNYTFRIDHMLGNKQRIFARASWYDRDSFYNDYFNSIATGTSFQFFSRQAVIDDVFLINPTTTLNVRYGYNRFIRTQDMAQGSRGFDLTSLGFPASYSSQIDPSIRRFPRIDFPGGTYQGTGHTNEFRPIDTHSISATLNKTIGSHSVKTGIEFRAYRENGFFANNNQTGQFVFDNTFTKQRDDTSTQQVALSFASFLLGIPTAGGVTRAADYAEQSTTWGFYVHDDWNVNSKLSLNLGLRYEFEGALTERFNRSVSGFDFSYVQPIEATVRSNFTAISDARLKADVPQLNVRGGLMFAEANGSRALYQTPKHNFMPRIGFAYKLNAMTVVRGGYGIFYGFLGQRRGDVIQTGYSLTTNFVPTTNAVEPNTGLVIFSSTLSNPFPNGILAPPGSSMGAQTNLGNNITFFNQKPQTPYNQRWNLGVQHELSDGFVVEASYVGNRGTHIEINRDLNAIPIKYLSTSPTRDAERISYLTGSVTNPFFGLIPGIGATATTPRLNLLKPFPHFGQVNTTTNDGYSWYHAGQLRVEKRFSTGYTVQASYTYSKFMQATEYLNPADLLPTRTISDSDYPHRFAMSAIAELQFGKGQRFLANSNGLVSRLISGWQVEGVYQYQTGMPLSFNVVTSTAATPGYIYQGSLGDIAIPSGQQSISRWLNTRGFVALRNSSGTVVTNNGQPVWVDFNDPCKNSYNATTCPGAPLAIPTGFNRDAAFQLLYNVRTFPLRLSYLRVQSTNNVDFSFVKNTSITDTKKLQFRAEFLNFFNHPWLSAPSGASGSAGVITTPTTSNFGQISNLSNQANYPRRVQLCLKFLF